MGVEPRPLPVHSPRVANARKRGAPPQSRFPLRYRGRVQGGELALGGVRLRRGARPLPLRGRGVRLLQGVRQRTTLAGDGLHRVGRSGSFEASALKFHKVWPITILTDAARTSFYPVDGRLIHRDARPRKEPNPLGRLSVGPVSFEAPVL